MKTIRQILAAYRSNDNNYTIEEAEKELLNLFSVNHYGEALYNTDGVIPSKFEDEKSRIVTFKDNCS